MNRSDLQRLSELRLGDAQALLEAGRLEGAYYLLGYAVECALKSCIARRIREFDFPDKKLANDSYIHDLSKLVTVAGLEGPNRAGRGAERSLRGQLVDGETMVGRRAL